MRAYERNGITVDQCGECRGIFLDRGELEHLVEADARAHQPAAAAAPPRRDDDHHRDDQHRDDRHRDDRYRDDDHYRSDSHGYPKKKRKGSWVDELFG